MLIRSLRIGRASYAGRFSGYAWKGMLRRSVRRCVGRRVGRGAYMNVKISLKLSRTSSAPWEAAVE